MNPGITQSCAMRLKVLAAETRLAIVRQLMVAPHSVGELNAAVPVDQSLLSHHLKVLRDSGLVRAERRGKSVIYHLSGAKRGESSPTSIDLGCCELTFP